MLIGMTKRGATAMMSLEIMLLKRKTVSLINGKAVPECSIPN